jgi:carboxypeptidase C (cathepsin A)
MKFPYFLNLTLSAAFLTSALAEVKPTPPPAPASKVPKGAKAAPPEEKPADAKDKKVDAAKAGKDAKDEKEKKEAKPEGTGNAKEKLSVTQHTLKLADKPLRYTATAGTMTLSKSGGEPRANVFFTAYTMNSGGHAKPQREGVQKPDAVEAANPRPVTFCFNGGPGSSAVWLHLGAFGPRRVLLPEGGTGTPKPPFQLVDNAHTLLEHTDLVFIDPVSTGYSRAEKGEDAKQFHGFSEDLESVGDFIRLYVSKNKRWASPKFLLGESYGAIRAAGLAGHLQDRYGMALNGVAIVSGLLDFQTLSASGPNDLPYIVFLPTMASVAFYHQKLSPELQKDRAATTAAAAEFAHGAYASALLRGAALPAGEKEKIAETLAKYTSLPKELILRENLRISSGLFFRKLLEKENKVVGRFDGRVVGDPEVGDPSYANVYSAFSSSLNAYIRTELKVENDQPYEILTSDVHPWNYKQFTNRYVTVAETLNEAMKANPSLKVYVACGHYDLATPSDGIRFSFNHMTLSDAQRKNVQFGDYEGGHMMYTNLPELEKLSAALRLFIDASK